MRNALICAGTMAAVVVVWPIAFGGAGGAVAAAQPPSNQASVTMLVPPPAPIAVSTPVSFTLPARGTETCAQTYRRLEQVCTDESCRLHAVDGLDICQGTGFWPR